jgi:hypothetical protein
MAGLNAVRAGYASVYRTSLHACRTAGARCAAGPGAPICLRTRAACGNPLAHEPPQAPRPGLRSAEVPRHMCTFAERRCERGLSQATRRLALIFRTLSPGSREALESQIMMPAQALPPASIHHDDGLVSVPRTPPSGPGFKSSSASR